MMDGKRLSVCVGQDSDELPSFGCREFTQPPIELSSGVREIAFDHFGVGRPVWRRRVEEHLIAANSACVGMRRQKKPGDCYDPMEGQPAHGVC